ncbi:MAG: InlB B-repeat-containing protein [Chloroflexota bacterium]
MRRAAALGALALALVFPAQALASQTLTVEKTGAGTGTVSSEPAGIDCGATCAAAFAEGAAVLLAGVAGPNSAAVKWAGCDAVTIENRCKVTMGSARKVTASFPLIKRKLVVEEKGTGTGTVTSKPAGINCGSTCTAEYDHGTEVTLTGVPGPNTEAVKWSGCDSVDGENKCLVTMSAAKSATATFNLNKVELKVTKGGLGAGTVTSSPSGINCGSTCAGIFGEGQTITLTGTSGVGTLPVQWSGCDSVNAEDKCVVTMSSAREVGALFNVEGPTLSVAKTGSGTGTVTSFPAALECGAACAVNFPKGQKVTLTGEAGLHTEAVKWSGCDTIEAGKCVVTMSSAREVTADFELEPGWVTYSVAVNLKGTGTGSVQSFPAGISCPGDCAESYVFKTALTLVATPAAGSEFSHWSGGGCYGSGPCERKINSDRTVNAVFVAIGTRTLTVNKAGSGQGTVTGKPTGTIECGSVCSKQVDATVKVGLHATPASGSTFAGWSGEGCAGTGACKVLMNEARNVTATFTKSSSPSATKCKVPKLRGKTVKQAKKALRRSHCALGKVTKPKGKGKLVVRSSKPGAGAVRAAGTKVRVKLVKAKKQTKRKH